MAISIGSTLQSDILAGGCVATFSVQNHEPAEEENRLEESGISPT